MTNIIDWETEFENIKQVQKVTDTDVYDNLEMSELKSKLYEYKKKLNEVKDNSKKLNEQLKDSLIKESMLYAEIGLMELKLKIKFKK